MSWLKLAEQAETPDDTDISDSSLTAGGAGIVGQRMQPVPWWQGHQPLVARYGLDEVKEAGRELLELVDQELLFADDSYLNGLADRKLASLSLKAICLNVSHDCDLGTAIAVQALWQ